MSQSTFASSGQQVRVADVLVRVMSSTRSTNVDFDWHGWTTGLPRKLALWFLLRLNSVVRWILWLLWRTNVRRQAVRVVWYVLVLFIALVRWERLHWWAYTTVRLLIWVTWSSLTKCCISRIRCQLGVWSAWMLSIAAEWNGRISGRAILVEEARTFVL